jgi:ABC-type phosphate transport system permease subunit
LASTQWRTEYLCILSGNLTYISGGDMTNIGRSIATIAAVLLVIGSAAFIVLRQPFVSDYTR